MEEKDGVVMTLHELERSPSHERLVTSSFLRRAESPRSTMMRGTGIGAFIGAAASKVWYTAYDGVVSLSLQPDTGSEQGRVSRIMGWYATKSNPSRETSWLDGMRGVAAFFVMAIHFNFHWIGLMLEAPYGAPLTDPWDVWRLPFIRLIFVSGHAQVGVFFIISGFVLSWNPLASIRAKRYDKVNQILASSVFRRWLRLYGTCFIIGAWTVVEYRIGVYKPPVERSATFLGQLWDYTKRYEIWANPLHIEREGYEFVNTYAWVMWTIPLEFAGSMLVFTTLLGISHVRQYSKRAMIMLGIAAYACVTARWTYWLFAYGMFLADYVREAGGFEELSKLTESKVAYRIICYVCFAVGLYLGGVPVPSSLYWTTGYDTILTGTPENYRKIEGGARYWWSWGAVMFVTSACHMSAVRKFFMLPLNQYFGRISFMLYLTHVYILECLSYPFRQALYERFGWFELKEKDVKIWVASPSVTVMIFLVLWTCLGLVALFVAHWCQVLVDEPCVRFARWIETQFVKEPAELDDLEQKPVLPR